MSLKTPAKPIKLLISEYYMESRGKQLIKSIEATIGMPKFLGYLEFRMMFLVHSAVLRLGAAVISFSAVCGVSPPIYDQSHIAPFAGTTSIPNGLGA